jgi:hypothetical protein
MTRIRITDEQIADIFYSANALEVEDKVNDILDGALGEMEEKLKDERLNVKNLLEVIVDLVGDHCASHLEPELTCPTCTALAFVAESKYWEGQKA